MTDTLKLPQPTWFIGCGNLGNAILDGWRAGGVALSGLTVVRPSGGEIAGARVVTSAADAGPPPKLVLLAIKPQTLEAVTADLRPRLAAKTLMVSTLAGVEAASLRQRFPGVAAVVRAMPNVNVSIRRGVIGLYSADADERQRQMLADLFAPLGFAPWLQDEDKLGALGAVAGAGPAYVARFIDALVKAGEKRGLSSEMATIIARETVLGTAWLSAATGDSMGSIAKRVASPNGTTEAGLKVLDHDHVLDELIAVTIDAAAQRSAELADETRTASVA